MASHSQPPPNWLDLPPDVFDSILRRLDKLEILSSVQYVCPTWRRICRDPSRWRSIDISFESEHLYTHRGLTELYPPEHLYTHHGLTLGTKILLTELYHRAVDLSSGGLLDVNMEHASDGRLLRYIANRSNHLRRLRLVYCDDITDFELIEVAGKLPYLEELELSYCRFSSKVVAAFGRHCPLLNSFKLNDDLGYKHPYIDDDEALAIAKNMSSLHHLQIVGNKLTNFGLIAILDKCQQLESLDLRRCFHVNLDAALKRRCTEGIKQFRGPNDSADDCPVKPALYVVSDMFGFFGDELDDEEVNDEHL